MLCKNVYIIGLQVDGKRVSFEYFEKLYKIQNDKYDAVSWGSLRVTRKLTRAHV
jgi:predicted ester cyclase